MRTVRFLEERELTYAPPRGNVLLVSCMDLRLLDDIIHFMDLDNLTNRYDHIVFAGAALGALGVPTSQGLVKPHWRETFFDHLGAAVELHDVRDVYILEHRQCGAYSSVFKVCPDFGNSAAEQREEERCHLKYADALEAEIRQWAKQQGRKMGVNKFLMDLRGQVITLPRAGRKAK
jgi:carbonic anhydrase